MELQPEIVFIYVDCTTFIYREATYHLGSGYVQAYLRQRGVNTRQLIVNSQVRLNRLVDLVLRQQPRIVGFTCYDSNYYISKLIAQLLKQRQPEIIVLMGGPSATFSDQLIMQDTYAVDACIRGEGEESMGEVVQRLRQHLDLTGIKGVTHRQGDRLMREADRRRRCGPIKEAELDIFPSPFLEGIFPPQEMARLGISTSRGCPYRCIYCNFATMSGHRVRCYSLDRVIAELKAIEATADTQLAPGEKLRVVIHDDAFSLNIARAKRLCRRLISAKLSHLRLACETRADHVDRELLELMHQAGFQHINFGLESAVPRVLRVIKKLSPAPANSLAPEKRFLRQTKQAVSWCQQVGIEPTVSIISGLPTETLEEGRATLEFVKKLGVREYFHNYLLLHAGTEVFEKQAEYGVGATPSAGCLPYTTKRHYDTRQIPILDGPELYDVGRIIPLWHYFYHIQRLMAAPISNRGGSCRDILLQQVAVIGRDFFHWLNSFICPSASLSAINDNPDMLKYKESIENMVRAGSPLLGFVRLVPGAERTPDIAEYVWQQGVLPQKPYYQSHLHRFYFVPFSKLAKLADITSDGDCRKRAVFLLLESEQDKQELIRLSELVAQQGFSALPPKLASLYCSFLNECCWRAEPCPAPGLSRLIVNEQGEVNTCLHGGVVGKVGDELAEIRRNLLFLKQAQAEERDCHHCRVSQECAKCLFPPMPAAEFCRLKRGYPSISNLVKILPYLRSAWLHKTLPLGVYQALFGNIEHQDRYKLELLTRMLDVRAKPLHKDQRKLTTESTEGKLEITIRKPGMQEGSMTQI